MFLTQTIPASAVSRPRPQAVRHLAALALLTASLGACSNVDRTVATSAIPVDYHERHPILLANGVHSLDIFLVGSGGQMDLRQKQDIASFAATYLAQGQGRIRVMMPKGQVNTQAAEATLTGVRRGLAAAGVKGDIEVGSYTVANARLASVLRLSFVELQARAAHHCGDWPDDLGSGPTTEGWENHPYYNLGCASQQTFAAQVDDPRDLVKPRAEQPGDVLMRTRAIQDLRGAPDAPKGTDPSTEFTQSKLTPIGGGSQ